MISQVVRVDITPTRLKPKRCCSRTISSRAWRPSTTSCFVTTSPIPYLPLLVTNSRGFLRFIAALSSGARYFGPSRAVGRCARASICCRRSFSFVPARTAYSRTVRAPALLHQIHRCTAPCGEIDEAHYALDVRLTALFLDGRASEVIDKLTGRCSRPPDNPNSEEAAASRDQIRSLQKVS